MLSLHSPTQEVQSQKKPLHTLDFVKTHISSHPRFCLFLTFLFIQVLVISIARNSPPCFPAVVRDPVVSTATGDKPPRFLTMKNAPPAESQMPDTGAGIRSGVLHSVLRWTRRGKYLWVNDTSKRDWHCEMMLQWVRKHKYWKKSNGSDHFITIGRITWDFRRLTDPGQIWGSTFLNMPAMQKVTRFIIEKAPGDDRDVSVPYPTGFHPKTREILNQWQNFARNYNRPSLFTFIGATRGWVNNDFRGLLLNYCYNEPGSCRVVDCATAQCSTDSSVILEALLGSEFCLQPRGDSFTRRSVFDCMVAGSVPVFFWKRTAYDQYEWFLPGEPESYSVYIDHEAVRNGSSSIKQVLMRYSKEEIRRKREKVLETIPRIVYRMGNGKFEDAFDIALNGVLERIKEEREWPSDR
ncbi:UNVERIFIED_CONTAM: Xyloglucan galactosyltransferase XLT2 [Sesamum calycinum]|uniref:Xyloglucan galactosyltransferase XLT2 n=1 Tax=Sesamum calycinum TaxID=2727403 RepID=A0AAW2JBG2_9LAMI